MTTMTITKPESEICDEIAREFLSYKNIVEVKHARKFIVEISAYYYEGLFEDCNNLIIGPDYSVLFAECDMDEECHIEAYSIGLRSKESTLAKMIADVQNSIN